VLPSLGLVNVELVAQLKACRGRALHLARCARCRSPSTRADSASAALAIAFAPRTAASGSGSDACAATSAARGHLTLYCGGDACTAAVRTKPAPVCGARNAPPALLAARTVSAFRRAECTSSSTGRAVCARARSAPRA
jgi:hypothetical protein